MPSKRSWAPILAKKAAIDRKKGGHDGCSSTLPRRFPMNKMAISRCVRLVSYMRIPIVILSSSLWLAANGCSSATSQKSVANEVEPLTGTTWQSQSFAVQYGEMTADYDAVPSANDEDVVVGLADGAPSAYTSL